MPVFKIALLFIIINFFYACENSKSSIQEDVDELTFNDLDTIPQIQSTRKDFAYPDIFQASFEKGTTFKQWGITHSFIIKKLGKISIPTGKIIITDPILLHDSKAFKYNFPMGRFQVELAIANIQNQDERVAFIRVLFSNEEIVQWKNAVKYGEEELEINSDDFYGFSVDAGAAMLLDSLDANHFIQQEVENIFDNIYEGNLSKQGLIVEEKKNEYIIFEMGYGDGYYGSYIGLDENNEIAQLIIDGQMVNWWNLKKE